MCNLANAYLQKGDIEKSIEMNKKMLKLAPHFSLGYNNCTNVHYLKGEFDEAIEYCDKALELGFEIHPEFLKLLESIVRKTIWMINDLFSRYENIAKKVIFSSKQFKKKNPLL